MVVSRTRPTIEPTEAQQNVQENEEDGQQDAQERIVSDVLGDGRPYLRTLYDGTALTDVRILEVGNACLTDEAAPLQGLVENGLSLVVLERVVRLDVIVGRYTYRLAVRTQRDHIGRRRLSGFLTDGIDECTVHHLAHILDLCRLVQRDNIVAAAREVDAAAQATDNEADNTDDDGNTPYGEAALVHTEEVEVLSLHEVL